MNARLLALLGFPLLAACGGDGPPSATGADTVVRPGRVEALDVGVTTLPLPDALQGDAGLSIAALDDGSTLIGGAAGLYILSSGTFSSIAEDAVTGLATVDGAALVGRSDGLFLYDGGLEIAPISETLDSGITALGLRGEDLFLGTEQTLFLLSGSELYAFDDLSAVDRIAAYSGGSTLIVDRPDGTLGLREEAGAWSFRDLSAEIAADAIVPAGNDRVLAAEAGRLVERLSGDDGAVWSPVALSDAEEDPGASGVEAIAVDPESGVVWVVTGQSVARLFAETVAVREKPAGFGVALAARTTNDSALWVWDGATLARFGNDRPPVTWSDDVATFSAANCERCHVPLGVGHPLDTYDAWVGEVDRIIDALENERMPQDGAPLVDGTAELIRRWKTDGLLP